MNENGNGKAKWIPVVIPIVAGALTVLGAVYVVGQRTNKIVEVVDWKKETAPRIERMDSEGTTSFKLFHEEYLRTQARQEGAISNLEKELHEKQISELRGRIETLERK